MDDAQPRVSVVVRSMARPSLAVALDALARQTYPSLEVVVVAACGSAHPPIPAAVGPHDARLVQHHRQLLRPAAANAGVEAARGQWIIFLDDDDVFLPGHVAAMVAASAQAPASGVVHAFARATFGDGKVVRIGQPHSPLELFERNYLHLAATLFRHDLYEAGCRFDDAMDPVEDWDFMLQLSQRTRFHFVPLESFVWHADVGTSGMGAAGNKDDARFDAVRERMLAKWLPVREAHAGRVLPLLEAAEGAIRSGRHAEGRAACEKVLALSQNNPWALNLAAASARATGDLALARRTQELAVAVRPNDAGLLHNLALTYLAAGDRAAALTACKRALALDPQFAPARLLHRELAPA